MAEIWIDPIDLKTGPFQPQGRTLRTHELQEWLQAVPDGLEKHPIQISGDGFILDGHRRVKAAISLGMREVPCVVVCEKAHSVEGFSFSVAPTLSEEDLPSQQLERIRLAESELGISFESIVTRLGYPMQRAKQLIKFSSLPQPVQESVDLFYKTNGGKGMAITTAIRLARNSEEAAIKASEEAENKRVTASRADKIAEEMSPQIRDNELLNNELQMVARRALENVLKAGNRQIAMGLRSLCEKVLEMSK